MSRFGWKRNGLIAAAGAAAFVLGALALSYFATHPRKRRLRTDRWSEMPVEPAAFASRDGLRLSGWFIPAQSARGVIVLCHGFPNNRSEMLFWARMLHEAGFHLLLFDFRALGESEGRLCTIGLHEVEDLLGAADYLGSRPETRGLPLGVFGLSMGGAVAIMTAARDARFVAVATHGAYSALESAIHQRCRLILGPLGRPLAAHAIWWGRRWFPAHPRAVSPREAVARIAPRPVLLLHGGRDRIVKPDDARLLFEAAGNPKSLHIFPRSWHVSVHPEETSTYQELLLDFFTRNLVA